MSLSPSLLFSPTTTSHHHQISDLRPMSPPILCPHSNSLSQISKNPQSENQGRFSFFPHQSTEIKEGTVVGTTTIVGTRVSVHRTSIYFSRSSVPQLTSPPCSPPSPEECDQAVEGLSSSKAKAKTKKVKESKSIFHRTCGVLSGIRPALRVVASMSR
ncbi:unnamed protein product [Lactuca virosa]|uniref:Uncharacterized protein n=1 Tax=Lactuca virosa TaxID=75947 RepID=A0AAU9LUC9_9ASTR|nr:unnamed protein product [Lactuca virosa]